MGDRNNPIKFGPEWLRNLSRERSAGSATSSQNSASTASAAAAGATGGAATSPTGNPNANSSNTPKVLLAKLRYGREEMLALYDRTSEAPQELKYIDMLYQPRGKPPVALNNSFEEELRDTMRTGPALGGMTSGERFGIGRGMGRGMNVCEIRGRGSRLPFVRQVSTGRGTTSWHLGSPKLPGYNGGADDDASSPRSWNNSNGGNAAARSGGDQGEWNQNKMYRSKRLGSSTNWRTTRDDEEWRASDNRSRSTQEKWDRDWGDRPTHRRTWVGGDSQSGDDNLPEWAVDSAEACGGTFDSLGAFHGYSNDDTNLPKSQEAPFALTRSHTHGSFARSKTLEEGSEEWWASEKAKKLSPKRFDASDIKFKKPNSVISELGSGASSSAIENNQEEKSVDKSDATIASEPSESSATNVDENYKRGVRFSESKTFDSFMRPDINLEEASDERGNFQSVMINTNNSLRQKHQNIVQSTNSVNRQNLKPGILQLMHNAQGTQSDTDLSKQKPLLEGKIVDDLLDMALEDKEQFSSISKLQQSNNMIGTSTSGIPSSMSSSVSQMTNATLQQLRISSPIHPVQGLSVNSKSGPSPGIQGSGLQTSVLQSNILQGVGLQGSGLHNTGLQGGNLQSNVLHGPASQGVVLQGSGLQGAGMQSLGLPGGRLQSSGLQNSGIPNTLQSSGIQSVGLTNSALNASLGLPLGQSNNALSQAMGIPMPGVPPPVMPNQGIGNPGVGVAGIQSGGQNISSFPSGLPGANVVNNSLFVGQKTNTSSIQPSNELQINHGNQNIFPLHGLQHSGSQTAFNSTIYSNLLQQAPTPNSSSSKSLTDQWYYEDPKKNIQGPFNSKEMYSWYRAGFFSPSLMVRRSCDAVMRPLGSYGHVVPFAQDHCFTQDHMMSPFPLSSGFEPRNHGSHDSMLNSQQGLGLDVESLWSQVSPSQDLLWMQQAMNSRNESRVNNLPMFFWDQQPSALAPNTLLSEGLPKEIKTEDEILSQLRAQSQKLPFGGVQPPLPPLPPLPMPPQPPLPPGNPPEDAYSTNKSMAPNLKDLHKLIQEDSLKYIPLPPKPKIEMVDVTEIEQVLLEDHNAKQKAAEANAKQTKEAEKSAKNKEINISKHKTTKKLKEERKEETMEAKKDEEIKVEKRSEFITEPSTAKGKKEDKVSKKEIEKEKKEWMREGFTIVKTEKPTKDSKKKADEIKAVEEAERKRKEEERLAAEEKKKRQADVYKKQQEIVQQQQQRQAAESVAKKAPWSGVSSQVQTLTKEGMTLAEIQRLEREKKLEQMKEQQQMMQLIAQQQAATLAREQEMQAGLGWAKKKTNLIASGQSLAEIQVEARKLAAAQAVAAAQNFEDTQSSAQIMINNVPWSNSQNGAGGNGGGFWDSPAPAPRPVVQSETPKPAEVSRSKRTSKVETATPTRKEVTPAAEFDSWCTTVLTSWSAKIDVSTFVGFLKDIESPYEVKDYVKCYLGDSKDSNEFARQFLERRSKLLRVGMVTPSDDLCSPAMAVNPRTNSSSDYQEAKSKGKKTKKNKMMKVDAARLLGFSVTAAEDRINVGDIDTV